MIDYHALSRHIEQVLIGGNHLAGLLGKNHIDYKASHDEARAHYFGVFVDGDDTKDAIISYEAWCCWKTIMELRDFMEYSKTD